MLIVSSSALLRRQRLLSLLAHFCVITRANVLRCSTVKHQRKKHKCWQVWQYNRMRVNVIGYGGSVNSCTDDCIIILHKPLCHSCLVKCWLSWKQQRKRKHILRPSSSLTLTVPFWNLFIHSFLSSCRWATETWVITSQFKTQMLHLLIKKEPKSLICYDILRLLLSRAQKPEDEELGCPYPTPANCTTRVTRGLIRLRKKKEKGFPSNNPSPCLFLLPRLVFTKGKKENKTKHSSGLWAALLSTLRWPHHCWLCRVTLGNAGLTGWVAAGCVFSWPRFWQEHALQPPARNPEDTTQCCRGSHPECPSWDIDTMSGRQTVCIFSELYQCDSVNVHNQSRPYHKILSN